MARNDLGQHRQHRPAGVPSPHERHRKAQSNAYALPAEDRRNTRSQLESIGEGVAIVAILREGVEASRQCGLNAEGGAPSVEACGRREIVDSAVRITKRSPRADAPGQSTGQAKRCRIGENRNTEAVDKVETAVVSAAQTPASTQLLGEVRVADDL